MIRVVEYVLAFIGIIVVVVGVHEGGHFAVAKWSGIRVDEFAIGFGPRIASRRRGETVYSLRALPLGGFVKMPGMSALEEDDAGERAFMRASAPRKMATILAGVAMNFLLAGLLFSLTAIPGEASRVQPLGPLQAAGLRDGDSILSVDGRPISHSDIDSVTADLHAATRDSRGQPVLIRYRRAGDGAVLTTTVRPYLLLTDLGAPADGNPVQIAVAAVNGAPVAAGDPRAVLGQGGRVTVSGHDADNPSRQVTATVSGVVDAEAAGASDRVAAGWRLGLSGGGVDGRSPLAALGTGFAEVPQGIGLTFKTIGQAIGSPSSGAAQNFQGPIGIAHDTAEATKAGWISYLSLMGGISLGLGIINVLPIPPFDGGRFAFIVGEVLTRRRLDARRELAIVITGVMLVITFVVFISVNDIKGF